MPITPRVALVTGSSRGIGAEIACELGARGMSVAVNYVRDVVAASEVVARVKAAGGEAEAFAADIGDPEQCEGLVERVIARFAVIHTLVNNAGIYSASTLEKSETELVRKLFAVNVFGVIATTRAATPHLLRAAAEAEAGSVSVVNISSIAARAEWGGASVYCATKAAVDALTHCHAAELGAKGVRVNAVAPGVTETDINRAGLTPAFRKQVSESTALGRVGAVGDIAPVVAFLASPAARWVTGQVLDADGGFRP